MNSQQLLYINLIIGLFFVLYFFLFRPKPKPPTRLNLRAGNSDPAKDIESEDRAEKVARVLEVRPAEVRPAEVRPAEVRSPEEPHPALPAPQLTEQSVKILSEQEASQPVFQTPPEVPVIEIPAPAPMKAAEILFVYNAHEWDSHEVLGLQRGATLREATEKYQLLIKTSDRSTFEFFEAAYSAFLKKRGHR